MKLTSIGAVKTRVNTKSILLVFGFALLSAVAARTRFCLPYILIPITLQTMVAALAGMILGKKLGALSQAQYLVMGLAGAPVFTYPPFGGPAMFLSPTFGYIPGFILGAYVAGLAWEKLGRRGMKSATISATLGIASIYIIGVPWFAGYLLVTTGQPASVCVAQAWLTGLAPFVGAEVFKVITAAAIASKSRI
ncbi:MAG: biotin transporter BioY [Armatimonadota bacterium]